MKRKKTNKKIEKKKKLIILFSAILICLMAGAIGSVFNSISIDTWYETIQRPAWNPPNIVFPIVWTALFILMGISLYFIWTAKKSKEKKKALWIFGIHLFLNIAWSFFFFTLMSPFLALIEILILWAFIVATMMQFYKVSKPAMYLLIPYVLWVTFAIFLNAQIYLLNVV